MANNLELVGITLVGFDPPVSLQDQAAKVVEEYHEFTMTQGRRPNIEQLAEEAFDLIQATITYLRKLEVDLEAANARHLAKMRERYG